MSPIAQQFAFLAELDKLKSVLRASPLVDGSRKENLAEHSWHIAMFALTLAEHSGGAGDSAGGPVSGRTPIATV